MKRYDDGGGCFTLIVLFVVLIICAAISMSIIESDLPTWLKYILLK